MKVIEILNDGCEMVIHGEDLWIVQQGVGQPIGFVRRNDLPELTGFEHSDFKELSKRIQTFLPPPRKSAQERAMEIQITFSARELNIIVAECRATLSIIDDVDFPTITSFQRSDMERILQEFLPLVSSEPR